MFVLSQYVQAQRAIVFQEEQMDVRKSYTYKVKIVQQMDVRKSYTYKVKIAAFINRICWICEEYFRGAWPFGYHIQYTRKIR